MGSTPTTGSIKRAWKEGLHPRSKRDNNGKVVLKNKGVARAAKLIRREEAIERQQALIDSGRTVTCRHKSGALPARVKSFEGA